MRPRAEHYRAPHRWPPGSGILLSVVAGLLGWALLLWALGVL